MTDVASSGRLLVRMRGIRPVRSTHGNVVFEVVGAHQDLEIRNRVAMGAMGNFGLTNTDGSFNQRCVDYFIERARGGVGLIVTGVCKVENEIEHFSPSSVPVVTQAAYGPFLELSEAVHGLGAKIFVQLTGGFGRVANCHFRNYVS